ncbi:loss of visual transmission isoform X2 [Lycorma delicatula]
MADKLHDYQGTLGRVHGWRDKCKERWQEWREQKPDGVQGLVRRVLRKEPQPPKEETGPKEEDYSHLYRKKSRSELVRVSAAVMGIEFSYAAETAFVSPTLLQIGVDHKHMTLVWALSPLVGFFLTPVLGSMSDQCKLKLGRRRPFIIMLALGVLIGLVLVPNGEKLGQMFGDYYPSLDPKYHNHPYEINITKYNNNNNSNSNSSVSNNTETVEVMLSDADFPHPWGIFFTVLGTVLLDFDADACQSPARAYLLDVTVPEDHAKGLSTFTIMAGLGGFLGYALGGINWDETAIGNMFGGHVRAVFSLITVIFIFCVLCTLTSFKELPLDLLHSDTHNKGIKDEDLGCIINDESIEVKPLSKDQHTYGSMHDYHSATGNGSLQETMFADNDLPQQKTDLLKNHDNGHINANYVEDIPPIQDHTVIPNLEEGAPPSLTEYLLSILYMPYSLKVLCLTNLFCWMSHVCYSLYFTDFVGEAVFQGDPKAPDGTLEKTLYEEGVRFGCWGMSMYSLSCACYSTIIEKLIKRYRAKPVYVGGLLFYSTGMFLMAVTAHRIGVILFSWTAGVMYSTVFTMPYLLVAHYHQHNTFEVGASGESVTMTRLRGLGTDVAIVSSMVFMAQFMLSICMGTIISVVGSTTAVAGVASFLAFCGAITATQVMYLDL